ncbi:hypothetical protein EON65_30305 [archaeon]|nr:MAG: hypothetical protein EON65_30305 [archaeon]
MVHGIVWYSALIIDICICRYHPTLAEILAKSFLNSPLFRLHAVKDLTQSPTFTFSEHLTLVNSMLCKGQVTIGDSRVDYMLSSPPAHPATTLSTSATAPSILVEVKNVVCAECCGVIDKAQRKVRFGVYRGDDGGMEGERQRGAGYVCISKRVGSECKGGNEHVPKKCAIFPAGNIPIMICVC